jgi:hypothetical protein
MGAPSRQASEPASASELASNPQYRSLIALRPLALIPLSQAELLHLQLQALA